MRPLTRLAPCIVFLSVFAAAQTVETPTTAGTNQGTPTPVAGGGLDSPSGTPGGANLSGPTTQGALGGVTPAPVPKPDAAAAVGAHPIVPVSGAALPIKAVVSPKAAASRVEETRSASSVLDTAAHGVEQGLQAEAAGGDGLSVRQALDRAYESSTRGAGVREGVAGKLSSAREKVANLVGIANNSAPADAPDLYGSAIKTADETLPAAAAAAVTKAVLSFAARKAGSSLSELVQAAYTAATAGQAAEARRFVKSLDKWQELLAPSGPPLIANGDRLKAGVESALSAASKISGAKGAAPRVWVVQRGESYVAVLPGTTVEKIPGLAATFALKFGTLSLAPMSEAYRAFVAAPGARSAIRARLAVGESVPSAVLGTGWLWLKYLMMRVWSALTSLLPGRGLPVVANASTLPRLRDAARACSDAAGLGNAAARAAGAPGLTVSRARGAFLLARRAAAAHEALTGEAGAVSRVDSLSAEFEAGIKRAMLSPADRLTSGLETSVSGDGGLRHWASRYAADARERGATAFGTVRGPSPIVVLGGGPAERAAATLAAASKGMSYTVFGDALWASGFGVYGAVTLSADLRSTENGGSIALEMERGDETLASSLDQLGFSVTRSGGGLRATLDVQTMSADAREMTELAANAQALVLGAPFKSAATSAGLERLLADMRHRPQAAARIAVSLDGSSRLLRAKTVGWVGDDEVVEIRSPGARVIALRDSATGLAKFARLEPLRAR